MFHPTIPDLQLFWDNTSLSALKTCPRLYYYRIICGYQPKGISSPLTFGSAIHECYEHYDRGIALGVDRTDVLKETVRLAFRLSENGFGDDSARTRIGLTRSVIWYADNYKNDQLKTYRFPDGTPALELSFRFQLPFYSPNGEAYIYCGHIDKLAYYNDHLYAVERKHTKTTLSDDYFQRYTFSAQVAGYIYAGKVCLEIPVVGAIIDSTQVGVTFSRFARRAATRLTENLEEWMHDTYFYIKQAEACVETDFWPHNTESCSKFGGCNFREVCSKGPAMKQVVLDHDFVINKWDPTVSREKLNTVKGEEG